MHRSGGGFQGAAIGSRDVERVGQGAPAVNEIIILAGLILAAAVGYGSRAISAQLDIPPAGSWPRKADVLEAQSC